MTTLHQQLLRAAGVRRRRQYHANGLAGCVEQRTSRATKTLVGLYHSHQSGMESDPDLPWATVCEEHNTLVCHPTLALARANLGQPHEWCDECRETKERKDV